MIKKCKAGVGFILDKSLKGSKVYLFLGNLCGGEVHSVKVRVLKCAFGCVEKKSESAQITTANNGGKFIPEIR